MWEPAQTGLLPDLGILLCIKWMQFFAAAQLLLHNLTLYAARDSTQH